MASELSWDHHFCLTCDKQTAGETYCSESCRLADYEGSALPGSGSSSPALSGPSSPWPVSQYATSRTSRFYIPPAYDFSNARPYGSKAKTTTLSPSSSFTSLCSMQSNASVSSTTTSQLSETARKELQAYAGAFGQRRRSSCS